MRIDRHIFGSVRGYQTLARTDGIADTDSRVLEGLSAGAPASSALLAALSSCPTYIVLPLGSRRAVTRICQGNPDDQGRPTIEQVTLAVSKVEWDGALQGDVLSLIRRKDLWKWDGQSALQPLELPSAGLAMGAASPESADKVLALLSLLERSASKGKPVLVREQDFALEEFGLLERLLPPAARNSQILIYRAFGTGLRASLLCMAREAVGLPADGLYRPGQPVDLSPYALAVAQAGFKLGHIPEGFVRSYRGFGMTARLHASAASSGKVAPMGLPPQVVVERMPPRMLVMTMIASMLFATLVGLAVWLMTTRTAENMHNTEVAALQKQHEKDLAKRDREAQEQHDQDSKALAEAQTQTTELHQKHSKDLSDAQRKTEQLQKEKLDNVIADLKALRDLPLPVFASRQRQQILEICKRVATRIADDPKAKADADEKIKDLAGLQAGMDDLRNELVADRKAPTDATSAKQRLVGILDARKIREAEVDDLRAFAQKTIDSVAVPTAPFQQGQSQTTPAPEPNAQAQRTPSMDLSDAIARYIADVGRIEEIRKLPADKELLAQLSVANTALGSYASLTDPNAKHKAREDLRRHLQDVVRILSKWKAANGEYTLRVQSSSEIDQTIQLVRTLLETKGGRIE